MSIAALACLVLLSPGESYALRYRFTKGLAYTDSQVRGVKITSIVEGRTITQHTIRTITLKRTILGVDKTAHPTVERVKVIAFRDQVVEWPEEEKVGTKKRPCEGQTFVWRRLETRWGLFRRGEDGKAKDVTKEHPHLLEQLKNWRDARLPAEPRRVGDGWEVDALEFLQTSGMNAPKGVRGKAFFKLEKVENGIATIPFTFRFGFSDRRTPITAAQKGTWLFDVAHGRDVAFEMKGRIEFDGGRAGTGVITMVRKVTYGSR